MEDQLITFETAKLAVYKELKNDNQPIVWYDDKGNLTYGIYDQDYLINKLDNPYYTALSQSLLQKWLREAHKIEIFVKKGYTYEWYIHNTHLGDNIYTSYEEALEKGLQEALLLIK